MHHIHLSTAILTGHKQQVKTPPPAQEQNKEKLSLLFVQLEMTLLYVKYILILEPNSAGLGGFFFVEPAYNLQMTKHNLLTSHSLQ